MADKVMRPKQVSRKGGIKQTNTSIVKGTTASGGNNNLNPYNRSSKK